jgi:ribonuclease VapC
MAIDTSAIIAIALLEAEAEQFSSLLAATPEPVAIESRRRFGRGTGHRAALNMGDCFSYALAKSRNLPLLFKGNDFIPTDIEPAI